MNSKFDSFVTRFKSDFGLHLKISAGLFLFILFFEPFPVSRFGFNNHILFIAGIGAIIFFSSIAASILMHWIDLLLVDFDTRPVIVSYSKGFLIFLISTVACIFYLKYVGLIKINLYIVFRTILICIAQPVILGIHQTIDDLRKQAVSLVSDRENVRVQIEKYEKDFVSRQVEFVSENAGENLTLEISEVAFIRSADNYVEIIYKDGSSFKKKLIRNTLKNIEYQIRNYSNFIRCHRICIVNRQFIENLKLINNSYVVTIKDYEDKLPVSRQYLLKVREAL